MRRVAAVSDCASRPTFATHSRPFASFTRYFFDQPPVSSLTKVRLDRSGCPASPPGP
jgi:hypothetical protein